MSASNFVRNFYIYVRLEYNSARGVPTRK